MNLAGRRTFLRSAAGAAALTCTRDTVQPGASRHLEDLVVGVPPTIHQAVNPTCIACRFEQGTAQTFLALRPTTRTIASATSRVPVSLIQRISLIARTIWRVSETTAANAPDSRRKNDREAGAWNHSHFRLRRLVFSGPCCTLAKVS